METVEKMSQLTKELEKAFQLLNDEFFDSQLTAPIITVIPTPRAYAHYIACNIWDANKIGKREINISSDSLDRPLEEILGSLLHEMVHEYNDIIVNIHDTSNNGVYHNKHFKNEAEKRGLIVIRSEKYGYCHTSPSEKLIQFTINHPELKKIELCRKSFKSFTTKKHYYKYICLSCGCSVRSTRKVNISCLDCKLPMVEVQQN